MRRLLLKLSPNSEPVDFNHLHILAGILHRWLGHNEEHDGLSLYTFSWLKGASARQGALHFPKGATWAISALKDDFLMRNMSGILRDPAMRWGMRVEQIQVQAPPAFPEGVSEQRFLCASPIFIKRQQPDGEEKHILYSDPLSDQFLTETLCHKLRAAGFSPEGVSVRFDRSYPKARSQKVMYRHIGNMANYCPVFVQGTPEQLAMAWTVGLGSSTGIGFGALEWEKEIHDAKLKKSPASGDF